MPNKTTLRIARSALIAAIYVALTFVFIPISYGPIQFRLSEALTLLPILMPEAIAGLTIGCLIANILSMFGAFDMIFGTLATFFASILTFILRKRIVLAGLPPVLLNALIVPVIFILNGEGASFTLYLFNVMTIFVSQAIIVYGLGIPLTLGLRKTLPLQSDKKNNVTNNTDNKKED